ncbi:MAG TPA: DUF4388 domain-containing protein, partial [Desulfuromonadales bacterium]|nr:DUF4388 domain-containing protein [Desulfuromonadales bacterium]
NMFRKTGILRFGLSGGVKELYFQQGEIVFAASTFPEEDLGEILCELGKLTPERLQKIRQAAFGRASLGKTLVDTGIATPKDLWLATRYQVETIVYHLFTFHQGHFSFLAKSLEKEEIVRLSMSTQNLIMEGLQRVDERALFMRSVGSLDAVPVPTGKSTELDASEERLMTLVRDGKLMVREVLRRSGLGEFAGLRLLYQLIDKKVLKMEDAPIVRLEGVIGEILTIFNGALVVLYRRIAEKNPHFDQEVRRFLRDLPQPFSYVFRDVHLLADGSLDGGRILMNLSGLEESDQKRLLADALSEVVYMECVAARRDLGEAAGAELIQRVQEISRRIKTLIGRTA